MTKKNSEMTEFDRIYDRALCLLELRDHSTKEIKDKLITKFGFDKKEIVIEVIEKLTDSGLLCDERFARTYADELIRIKHVSKSGLTNALYKRGISRDIVSIILEEYEIDSKKNIEILLDTKFRTRDLTNEKEREKTINALFRLGFDVYEIKSVIDCKLVSS